MNTIYFTSSLHGEKEQAFRCTIETELEAFLLVMVQWYSISVRPGLQRQSQTALPRSIGLSFEPANHPSEH